MTVTIKPLVGNVTSRELMKLAEAMVAESRFAPLGVDKDKLFFHVSNILSGDQWIALGAFDTEVLVGMVIGVCGEVLPFSASRVATEHYLFLLPDYRRGNDGTRLVWEFVDEARRRGARDIVLSNGYGGDPDKVGRLFERCGATRIGGIYTFGG